MKKLTSTFILILIIGFLVNAQLQVGIKGGLNYAKWIHSDDKENQLKPILGFHGGFTVLAGLSMGSGLELETGLYISQKGFKEEDIFDEEEYSFLFLPLYIDLPLKLNYVFEGMNGSFIIGAGPTISYGVAGKYIAVMNGEEIRDDISWGSESGFMNPLDIALGIHGGVRLTKLQISAFFDKGLNNILNSSGPTAKNQVLGVSLGYIF
jgi:hypothetical protein